jgi:hypothetical protein
MTVAPSAPNHDLRAAAAILVAIAALLPLAWQSPPPAAVAAVEATPAVGGPAAFDLDAAMALAGRQVPQERDSFYFFVMLEPVPEAVDVAELGAKMLAASAERDFLGVAGPDADRNRRTLLAALDARRADDLSGMILIYLGPSRDRDAIGRAAAAARVELRYVDYPADAPI